MTRRSAPFLLAAAALGLSLTLAACSQAPLNPGTETPLELDWRSADIGDVSIPGSTEVLPADGVRVTGAGADIWGYADAFHFAYVGVTGDVTIVARVESIDETHQWAKAGVMIRAGLGADAAHALMSLQPSGDAEFIYRSQTGGPTDGTFRAGTQPPTWVRLERRGTRLSGAISHDGQNWSDVGSVDIALGDAVFVGVAITSHNLEVPATGTVTNVRLFRPGAPAPTPAPPPNTPGGDVYTGDWVCPTAPLTPAYAPTMWVATTGSDGNDGRASDRPLRTLQAAAGRVGPGDVVWVAGGSYTAPITFGASGTASAPIVFESAPGECAVIDNQRVILDGVSHMVFRNFVVRNSSSEGVFLIGANDNEVSHVRAHGHVGSGFLLLDSSRNVLSYVIAHDNFDPPYGGNADGISVSRGDANRIEHCMSYRNSDDGVDTWLSTNSVISYCASFDNGWQGGDGNGFKAGGQGVTTNTVIRHSVAFGNKVNGFDWNTSPGFTFDNNTAFGNGSTGFVGDRGTMRNNLAFGNGGSVSGNASQTTNSWNLGLSSPGFVSTDRIADGFLALAASSGAIEAGTPIGLPYTGTRPDLGAVPYGETLGSFLGVRIDGID